MQILGREVGNFYTRSELKHLIQMHVENPEHPVRSAALSCLEGPLHIIYLTSKSYVQNSQGLQLTPCTFP